MAHHRDAQLLEVICIADTREHEQLRRVDGTPAQNHLRAGVSLEEAQACRSQFLKSQTEPGERGLSVKSPSGGRGSRSQAPEDGRGCSGGRPGKALGRCSSGARY